MSGKRKQFDPHAMTRGTDELQVEQDLWAAVLEERINGALGGVILVEGGSAKSKQRMWRAKHHAWLMSDEDFVGSFSFVCDALNLDHRYVRRLYKESCHESTDLGDDACVNP